jgi:Ulp1 family protease
MSYQDHFLSNMFAVEAGTPPSGSEIERVRLLERERRARAEESDSRPGDVLVSTALDGNSQWPVRVRDLRRLRGQNTLNDELINYSLVCMATGMDNVLVLSTYFHTNLLAGRAERWLRKAELLKTKDTILVPINVNSNHWVLLVVRLEKKQFTYYDSLRGTKDQVQELVFPVAKWIERHSKKHATATDWPVKIHTDANAARQRNGYDCGVFVIFTSFCVLHRRNIVYSQDDTPLIRARLETAIALSPGARKRRRSE